MVENFTDGVSNLNRGRAIKAIDLCPGTLAQDQMMIIWDNPSNSFKLIAQPSSSLSEIQYLASQSANMVYATGNRNAAGVICSIVPAAGKTLTLYQASITSDRTTGAGGIQQLRNNASVRDICNCGVSTSVGLSSFKYFFITKGDQLVGDGAKSYDVNISVATTDVVYGSIQAIVA